MRGSSAFEAGVLPGDELLAINGTRVMKERIDDRMQRLLPGEQAELTLVRHQRVFTLPVTVEAAIPVEYVIAPQANINNRQVRRLETWLGKKLQFSK
jgi:predicted metalloprotease with PDZ domain